MTNKTFKEKKDNEVKTNIEKNKFLAIILKLNKSLKLHWVSLNYDEFSLDGHTYFTFPDGMYLDKNKLLLGIYIEGISTPLSHKNVEQETIEKQIKLENGETKEVKLNVIKGLKYDSEIIDILLNRGLAEKFTEVKPEKTIYVLFIMVIINIIIGIISVGANFV